VGCSCRQLRLGRLDWPLGAALRLCVCVASQFDSGIVAWIQYLFVKCGPVHLHGTSSVPRGASVLDWDLFACKFDDQGCFKSYDKTAVKTYGKAYDTTFGKTFGQALEFHSGTYGKTHELDGSVFLDGGRVIFLDAGPSRGHVSVCPALNNYVGVKLNDQTFGDPFEKSQSYGKPDDKTFGNTYGKSSDTTFGANYGQSLELTLETYGKSHLETFVKTSESSFDKAYVQTYGQTPECLETDGNARHRLSFGWPVCSSSSASSAAMARAGRDALRVPSLRVDIWLVMTPTLDLHEEDVLHLEVMTVCGGPRGGLRQLAGQAAFRFDRDELLAIYERLALEGRELAATLLEERGLRAGGAPPDVVAFGGPREDEVREPPRPARLSLGVEVDEDIWVVPERRENFSTGDPIAVKGRGKSFTRVGDRGLLQLAAGCVVAVGLFGTTDLDFAQKAVPDVRILEQRPSLAHRAARSFPDAADAFFEGVIGYVAEKFAAEGVVFQEQRGWRKAGQGARRGGRRAGMPGARCHAGGAPGKQ
jgi:hypothetical protein